jgi:glycerate-2-kinase
VAESARRLLEQLLKDALKAVHAGDALRRAIPEESVADARPHVIAIGKAAAAMSHAAETLVGDRIRGGLVITKDGHGDPAPRRLTLREAAHPVPDSRSEAAAHEALALASGLPRGSELWLLLSGGASALTACPAPGLTLQDLARTTEVLLACGADIEAMNTLRKHLSSFSGGRLAVAANGARIRVLAVSDVPGDRLDVIGSGPCEPDPSSFADAVALLDSLGIREALPAVVRTHLDRGVRGEVEETPEPGNACFANVESRIVARNSDAIDAATQSARGLGLEVVDLGQWLSGEARDAGRNLAALGCTTRRGARPQLLIAGGETVVTLQGAGRGGRNQELALSAALALAEAGTAADGIALLAAGTDGTDGPTPAAGAVVDRHSVARGAEHGSSAAGSLAANDSHTFFTATGELVSTGPTGTNVMDLAMLLVPAA